MIDVRMRRIGIAAVWAAVLVVIVALAFLNAPASSRSIAANAGGASSARTTLPTVYEFTTDT